MERLGRGLNRPVRDFQHGFGREAADPGDNPHSGVYAGTWGPGRLLVASGANTLILGYTPGVRRVTPGCPAESRRNRGKPMEIRRRIRTNLKTSEKNLKICLFFSDFFRFVQIVFRFDRILFRISIGFPRFLRDSAHPGVTLRTPGVYPRMRVFAPEATRSRPGPQVPAYTPE